MHAVRCKGVSNECRRCGICPIKDDEHPPCGCAENEPCNAAKLKTADLCKHIQTVVRIGAVDIEGATDDFDLMRETCVGDVCTASRDLLGGEAKECRDHRRTRCCVGNAHLAGQDTAVAAIGTVIRDGNACFNGLDCLCACHGRSFGHVCCAACNAVMEQSRYVCVLRIHAKIGNDKVCVCIVCGGVCRTAACDEIVAHHVQRGFGRIGTDALGGDTVVGAGDDDTCLRRRGMALARDIDIAQKIRGQLPKIQGLSRQYGSNGVAEAHVGRFYAFYRSFEKIHACAFSFLMRFKERPMRSRSSSTLIIMTSSASPTDSMSSG